MSGGGLLELRLRKTGVFYLVRMATAQSGGSAAIECQEGYCAEVFGAGVGREFARSSFTREKSTKNAKSEAMIRRNRKKKLASRSFWRRAAAVFQATRL